MPWELLMVGSWRISSFTGIGIWDLYLLAQEEPGRKYKVNPSSSKEINKQSAEGINVFSPDPNSLQHPFHCPEGILPGPDRSVVVE